MTYCGLDIGTSSVKAVLIDENQNSIATASHELTTDRPHKLWSEQRAEDWWGGVLAVMDSISESASRQMQCLKGIGLSGQMHGATLLGENDKVLRPCILWNDGRSQKECFELEESEPKFRKVGGNIVMPGFTAPKLAWVRKNEPEIFKEIRKVLLPKDYIRLQLTGEYVSDLSDSSGTLWLDVANRKWDESLLAATGLNFANMPNLVEGSQFSGQLRSGLADRWKIAGVVAVAGGGGDNAASACGVGAVNPGSSFLSLGTSGVLFVTTDNFSPNTERAVHTFCHAIPDTWHQMGVVLSAASSLEWLSGLLQESPSQLTALVGSVSKPADVMFLPYLSGERTPHNDVNVRGVFAGIDHTTDRKELAHSVMDGISFAIGDCMNAITQGVPKPSKVMAVGGGSKSDGWLEIISSLLNLPVEVPIDGDFGGAFGAARLAICAAENINPKTVCFQPATKKTIEPNKNLHDLYEETYSRWRSLYPAIKEVNV